MLTYELKKVPGVPLYESLYRCIRRDILSGNLAPGQKLPSKRALAQNLEISKITVEAAYSQLLAEGFLRSQEKVGYFVEDAHRLPQGAAPAATFQPVPETASPALSNGAPHFPFSVWMKLQREVMLDYGEKLLLPLHNQGIPELRNAIAQHLSAFRGMQVDPGNILIGAGTDFLYNLLIQLLGRDKTYAVEEPGYGKIRKIYAAGGVACISAHIDGSGVVPEAIKDADVLHFSPSHHFPTGLVTPVSRRQELLQWAGSKKWIVEDDYDSEFRFDAHPMPAMLSLNPHRVIYMNSFSKTLAPSIRISYMVLPRELMEKFRRDLGFYSCTVASFEQYTLARFLDRGHFEKHINRMRKFYKQRRNALIAQIKSCPIADKLTILEQDAGLHFLLRLDTKLSDRAIKEKLAAASLPLRLISEYYLDGSADRRCLVVNYSGLKEEDFQKALDVLEHIL